MSDCCGNGRARETSCGGAEKEDPTKVSSGGRVLSGSPIRVTGCCGGGSAERDALEADCCGGGKGGIDWLLWGAVIAIAAGMMGHFLGVGPGWWQTYAHATYEFMMKAWWGIVVGVVAVAVIGRFPKELILGLLGKGGTFRGILRATFAGVFLDLCNHGILMIGMQLYRKGASLGQTMAFLVASPWNSLTLTLILIGMIGWKWTLAFIGLSMAIGIITGLVVDLLVRRGRIPANRHETELPEGFRFKAAFAEVARGLKPTRKNLKELAVSGWTESRMILRWIFFGIALAGVIRAGVPEDIFGKFFGPSLMGLVLTLIATTVIEVCSEGSSPIAADLLTRAQAPGNAFTFLMAGAATDYTEILALRETTKSWKATLALPLVTVPQVLVVSWILNGGV
ncbi:MAG: permease [Verrucomicrobiales bacterium]